MSTVSGEDSVRLNPAKRRISPGQRGRRLVLTCINQHIVPERVRYLLPGERWRCKECGTRRRTYIWLCAPLLHVVWEWLVSGCTWIFRRK